MTNSILCFGTFAKTLNFFRTEDISQKEFIAKMVEVIDPDNLCIQCDRYTKKDSVGNGPVIAKFLKCEYNFKFSDKTDTRSKLLNELEENEKQKIQNISNSLKTNVCSYIVDRAKPLIILALLNIISEDECINKENGIAFKKYFGMSKQEFLRKNEYDFSELLCRVLLYTTLGGVNSEKGKNCIDNITENFVNNCTNSYTSDCQWDNDTQVLKIPYLKIFNNFLKAIDDYNVKNFIIEVDPTVCIEEKWEDIIDEFDNFRKLINKEIIEPYENNSSEMTKNMILKIEIFYQTLNEYNEYLGQHMIPSASTRNLPQYENDDDEDSFRLKLEKWMKQNRETPTFLIPKFRDESMEWYSHFIKNVKNKRETLCKIFEEIDQMSEKYTVKL